MQKIVGEHPVITEAYLNNLYIELRLSCNQIAKIVGSTVSTVSNAAKLYGIPLRVAISPKGVTARELNVKWAGDDVGYAGAHHRLRKLFGRPKKCDTCGTTDPNKMYDWANQTGNYIDIKDYKRLCRSCHNTLDKGRGPYLAKIRAKHYEIIRMYEAGEYVYSIAEKFNTTKKNIESIIERARRRGVVITRSVMVKRLNSGVVGIVDNSNHA